jgi:hypothetical protein
MSDCLFKILWLSWTFPYLYSHCQLST